MVLAHRSLITVSRIRRIICAAVTLVLSAAVMAASRPDPNIERVEKGLLPVAAERIGVPATITDRMRAYGVSGVSIAVIDNGRIVWDKGYGVEDTTSGPITAKTLFRRFDQQADQRDGRVAARSEGTLAPRPRCQHGTQELEDYGKQFDARSSGYASDAVEPHGRFGPFWRK